ncbi:Ail/Lom family outer membrane beta-barrel protein [Citrobacter werkmanii]|uniref:Ail/Lom family outer membrane beta-barrel protein n=1 Tax=Citrobacter werkmanii TaxID=67827 RepID=UPI001901063D|nr:Ail/Lom family outer membrane beta-barrel protein [Citrobacter werkmanii]MBJ9295179.1 Ail/Lom family outer membrane beta-barrel protein [Citrobacter werkmanii]MDO8232060.1 Ail/Lom family outer membrane beta-barrel protein [Citrobacter werkmanii]
MQRIFSSWIMAALLTFPSLALAMGNHTLSLGYAQTHLSALNKSASKDLHGLNLKYRYEFNSDWGILTSLTATRHDAQNYSWDAGKLHKDGDNTTSYSSLMIGPTYRINDYVSLYGNVGMAGMKIKNHDNQSSSEDAFAYGAGLILNPLANLSLDLSWETAKLLFVDTNTFGVSVGYRF